MPARLSAFVIWALVAATAVFWGLRLAVRAPVAPPYTVAVGEGATVRGDLARLLGATPVAVAPTAVAPEAASRFRLLGVVAPKDAGAGGARGVALIAVDGKMPKAIPVGSSVDGDLTLQSVGLRSASIGAGSGGAPITLELPRPVPPATGTLSIGGSGAAAANPGVPGAVPPAGVTSPAMPLQAPNPNGMAGSPPMGNGMPMNGLPPGAMSQ